MISPSQRPLPDNTQHSQQTNIHDPGGIRTHDRSRRAAVDLHLRPRGYWDRPLHTLQLLNYWTHLDDWALTKRCWVILGLILPVIYTLHKMRLKSDVSNEIKRKKFKTHDIYLKIFFSILLIFNNMPRNIPVISDYLVFISRAVRSVIADFYSAS